MQRMLSFLDRTRATMFSSLLLLAALGGCSGGGDNSAEPSVPQIADWTYMVYIAADNNLSNAGIRDLNEMESIGSNDRIQIVVQAEFSRTYSTDLAADKHNKTLRGLVERDDNPNHISSPLLPVDGSNLNMAAKETLSDFIIWATETYPAKHFALVIWDHGLGWKDKGRTSGGFRGAIEDETSNRTMSLADMANAIAASGVHIDLINFDACLMAMYEVVHAFEGLTDYMVFSEESEPMAGDPYDTILGNLLSQPQISPKELAVMITDAFLAYYEEEGYTYITKSAFDMQVAPALHTAVQEFAGVLTNEMETERPFIQLAREASVAYDTPENHDLGDFLAHLIKASRNEKVVQSAQNLEQVLTDGIIRTHAFSHNQDDEIFQSTGLAIYLPRKSQVSPDELSLYNQLRVNRDSVGNSWGNFINLLVTGETAPDFNQKNAVGNFVVRLEWEGTADLDLIIREPNGDIAAPFLGSTSENGFLSKESSGSGEQVEYYQANSEITAGNYDIIVNMFKSAHDGPTMASLFFKDPENGIVEFELIAQNDSLSLDLSAPVFLNTNSVVDNQILAGVYSNWWYVDTLQRTEEDDPEASRWIHYNENNMTTVNKNRYDRRQYFVPFDQPLTPELSSLNRLGDAP